MYFISVRICIHCKKINKGIICKYWSITELECITQQAVLRLVIYYVIYNIVAMAGRSKGNKQVNKNAAKERSTDSNKNKKLAKSRNDLGLGGQSRGRSKRQK